MIYRLLFFISFCILHSLAHSQDAPSWKVILNKKVILTGKGEEDSVKNKIQVKKSDLSNNNIFKLDYSNGNDKTMKGWVRTLALIDTTSTIVMQQDSITLLQFYNKDMMKILWSRRRLNIYTWTRPLDTGMAAAIRIRRFHLCTIELID